MVQELVSKLGKTTRIILDEPARTIFVIEPDPEKVTIRQLNSFLKEMKLRNCSCSIKRKKRKLTVVCGCRDIMRKI